ncbi:hypothetical protein MHI04_10895 [Lysinibacillus sp. FSL K6-1151]|uniref:hypothetical protein n=1 Tax=Lysinibacillus sp. FSL K6-1151 TaxID=2921465 RepID=UPI00315A4A34
MLSIFYWALISILTLFTVTKIRNQKTRKDKVNEGDFILNALIKVLKIIEGIIVSMVFILMKILLPILVSIFLYIVIFISSGCMIVVIIKLFNLKDIKIPIEAFGYATITLTSIVYAHVNRFKILYMNLLKGIKMFYSIPFADYAFEDEASKISKDLLRQHVYILLAILYFGFNFLNFLAIIDKDHFSSITESLLTFVILDTIIVINRDFKKKNNSSS